MKATQTRGRTGLLAVLIPALVLLTGSAAWAQVTQGEVRGTVNDTTGAVVPNATVKVVNTATGYTRQISTDAKGEYVLPLLPPGNYRVEVEAAGFKKSNKEVAVRALQTTSVPVQLEVGAITEVVTVSALSEQVNVSSGGVAQRLGNELLADFPNLNRYGFANAPLMPAIQQYEERRETINASVAGNTTNRNSFYIDGAEATDPWRGWSPRQPVVDAFDEIVVNTAGSTVDTGSNFGGTYNAILKSGTNNWHGSAWYYFRNASLNANPWVNNKSALDRPEDPLKYFGAQGGGPIIKDKLFFYVTANRETDQQPFTLQGYYAPTAAMIGGDFSALPFTILDPDTGLPFQGNVIPQDRLDPVSVAFWDKYGYSTASYDRNWGFQFANERKVTNINGRMDYTINDAHRLTLSGYYFVNKTTSPDARVQSISGTPTGGTNGNTFGDSLAGGTELSEFPQTVVNLKHTWTVKPNLFIETHGSYSNMPEKVVLSSEALGTTLQSLGSNDPLPRNDPASEMLPSIVIGAWWGSPETAVLFHGWTTDFTVKNTTLGSSATWIEGSHNVKVGFEFQQGAFNTIKPAQENNNGLSFTGNATSNNNPWQGDGAKFAYSFADFMLGRFDTYGVIDGFDQTLNSQNLAVYVQDQWRLTPKLTTTLGLRLERNSGITEDQNRLTLYRPGLNSTIYPNAPDGVVVAGDAGLSDSLSGSFTKISPRFNFAYDLTGDGKTAVRGSAGLYYGRDVLALYETYFMRKAPFTGGSAFARNGLLRDPWLTSQNPTYSTVPLPFVDQDPASYNWPSQVSGLNSMDPNYSLGSSIQWNVAVEREVLKGLRLELGYQGNNSTSTPTGVPQNLAAWAPGANDSGSNIASRRPNQFVGDNLNMVVNDGRSRYDQILLISRVRRPGLFAQLSWAYTHARRNFGGTTAQGNRDWDSQVMLPGYIDSLFDFTNNQTVAGFLVYDLPILRDNTTALGKVLGGWSLTANGYWSFFNKGQSVYAGYDANADAWGNDLAALVGTISYPKTELNQGDLLYQWFDSAAFAYPDGSNTQSFTSTTTTGGLNALSMPGSWRVDAGLMKNFKLTDTAKLQLRFEVYNLMNHANLNWPNTSVNNTDFGKIRGKSGDARRIQLGARLMF